MEAIVDETFGHIHDLNATFLEFGHINQKLMGHVAVLTDLLDLVLMLNTILDIVSVQQGHDG